MRRGSSRVRVGVLRREELPFLLDLWRIPEVMRYADELPRFRGWRKSSDPADAWREYQRRRATDGPVYTQLVVRLPNGEPVGESFFAPLPEGFTIGPWRKPRGKLAILGDIKLLPERWGRGLGTEAMRKIVDWAFQRTDCDLFVVPPHRSNHAAERVYEKAGFVLFPGMRSEPGHRVMVLSRERYGRQRDRE